MNADKQQTDLNDLPMVEFVGNDNQPGEIIRTYPLPPPLPVKLLESVTTYDRSFSPVESKPPVCYRESLATSIIKADWPELLNNIQPRSLLLALILIPYVWFMSIGVSEGNVPWGVVMLLAGGGLTLGWYGFLGLAKLSTRRGEELALRVIQVFLATAVIGVALLLLFQGVLSLVDQYWERPFGEKRLAILFVIIKVLATGYQTAFTAGPLPNPVWYFLCTFVSVALCEELLKLFPVLLISAFQERRAATKAEKKKFSKQELLFLAAMSGMGFGFSEALMYTADIYRPLQLGFSIYFLRFMCLVIMHGLWGFLSTAVYLQIKAQGVIQQKWKVISLAIVGPMLLHALHNSASLYETSFLGLLGIILAISAALFVSSSTSSLPCVQDKV